MRTINQLLVLAALLCLPFAAQAVTCEVPDNGNGGRWREEPPGMREERRAFAPAVLAARRPAA